MSCKTKGMVDGSGVEKHVVMRDLRHRQHSMLVSDDRGVEFRSFEVSLFFSP